MVGGGFLQDPSSRENTDWMLGPAKVLLKLNIYNFSVAYFLEQYTQTSLNIMTEKVWHSFWSYKNQLIIFLEHSVMQLEAVGYGAKPQRANKRRKVNKRAMISN